MNEANLVILTPFKKVGICLLLMVYFFYFLIDFLFRTLYIIYVTSKIGGIMPYRIIYWKTVQDFQNGKESEWEEFETENELVQKVLELKNSKAIYHPQYIDEEGIVTELSDSMLMLI